MTGWRLGYGVFPEFMVEDISKLMTNSVSCTSVFSQMAGIQALEGPQDCVAEIMKEFNIRRKLIVEGINKLNGISCTQPKGAFYAFPNISNTGMTSKEFADKALYECGVALLPGTAFGEFGEGYVRISFANSSKNLNEANYSICSFDNYYLDQDINFNPRELPRAYSECFKDFMNAVINYFD